MAAGAGRGENRIQAIILLPTHFDFFGASLQTPLATPLFTGQDTETQRGEGVAQAGAAALEPKARRKEGVQRSELGVGREGRARA